MKYILIALFLMGCGSESKQTTPPIPETPKELQITATPTNNNCSWWERPQYYNGVPKYSGAFCTYTHKHIPLAVYGDESLFYVTTDNTQDDNFYVYAHKDEEKVLVHTIKDWNDPHTNASIQIDNDGYVMVHIASRGLNFKFQSGKILKSKTPHSLDFECIDGCNNVNFEAYPQVFDTDFGYYVGYTHYVKDSEIHASRNIREIWYRIGDKRTRIAKGAHYQNTFYDNGTIYVTFNYLKHGSPEQRHNLFLIKTKDGVNWTNYKDELVSLPLDQNDSTALIHETESKLNNVYLKDLTVKNGLRILFTETTNDDPTDGSRAVKEWHDGYIYDITSTNHNYSSGAYVHLNNKLYILTNTDNGIPYLGGDIAVFNDKHEQVKTLSGGNYSYIRKVYGADGMAVSGEGVSDAFITSEHVKIELSLD